MKTFHANFPFMIQSPQNLRSNPYKPYKKFESNVLIFTRNSPSRFQRSTIIGLKYYRTFICFTKRLKYSANFLKKQFFLLCNHSRQVNINKDHTVNMKNYSVIYIMRAYKIYGLTYIAFGAMLTNHTFTD